MTSPHLSRIPIEKRRRMAATIGLFATLFIAVGAVAATGPGTVTIKIFVGLAFVVAVVLGLVSWGVLTSVKHDLAEQQLDAAIEATVAARGGLACGCGHEHDPNELHVTDAEAACAHDGAGDACAHDCTTCVLAALRPAPRPRPRPYPTR